eukprot:SAG11_NODE_36954_length_259_cov_0.643750_1_plen_77_part_10
MLSVASSQTKEALVKKYTEPHKLAVEKIQDGVMKYVTVWVLILVFYLYCTASLDDCWLSPTEMAADPEAAAFALAMS